MVEAPGTETFTLDIRLVRDNHGRNSRNMNITVARNVKKKHYSARSRKRHKKNDCRTRSLNEFTIFLENQCHPKNSINQITASVPSPSEKNNIRIFILKNWNVVKMEPLRSKILHRYLKLIFICSPVTNLPILLTPPQFPRDNCDLENVIKF